MKNSLTNILIGILLLLGSWPYAQVWNTVGGGLPGSWAFANIEMASTEDNGNIYVAYTNFNNWVTPFVATTTVKKWDGLSWTAYPTIVNGDFVIGDIEIIGSTIYLVGGSNSLAFYEFDGNSWIAKAPPAFSGFSFASEVINGELMVGGSFTATGMDNLFSYDGTNFSAYPAMPSAQGYVIDIHEFNNNLYVSLYLSSSNPEGLIKLNATGTGWEQPAHFYGGTTFITNEFKIFDFRNRLYVADGYFSRTPIFEVANDSLIFITTLAHNVRDFERYNGEMYLVGDTTAMVSSPNRITKFDGTSFTPILGGPSTIAGIDTLNSELYVFSKTTNSLNGITYNHAFRTQANFSLLSGETFVDGNSDCFRDANETAVPNALVSLGGHVFTSDVNGQYSVGLLPGTYSFDTIFSPRKAWKNASSSCPLPNNITLGPNSSVVQNIGFKNLINTDLLTTFNSYRGSRAVYGFTEVYQLSVSNAGIVTLPSTSVTVDVPPSLTFISSNPPPSSVKGNSCTYNLMNIQPLESRNVTLEVNIGTSSNSLGDSLIWHAYLDAVPGDADLTDNADTLEQIITGSYDPNDKQASASEILPGTETIDYHIRFQNTGTDTAYKVTVVDTLDITLPVTQIMINSASHPYNFKVSDNILIWEFDNIMLPDSGADYAGSQGYVRFSAGINPALGVGDTIDNDAEIYFDYQPPVHTNHAKTAIVKNVSLAEYAGPLQVDIYPNPAQNELYILNRENETINFQLIDATGKTVEKFTVLPDQREEISIQALSPGLYFLKSGVASYKVVITSE